MDIHVMIDEVEKSIFEYNVDAVPKQISNIMAEILKTEMFDLGDKGKIMNFNLLMDTSLQAMQNKDYLLLADIMEFKLKSFLGIEG